jgi:hypothetical protein
VKRIFANSAKFRRRVIVTIIAVAGAALAGEAQPAASVAEAPAVSGAVASARDDTEDSRNGKSEVGIRGHGFIADNGAFTTIDAPGAGLFTVAFGIDDR